MSQLDRESNRAVRMSVTPWLSAGDGDADRLCEQAVYAEELGFDGFFLPENHFAGTGSIPEPLMLLAAVAARTSRIRLGTSSYLLPVRHPLQAAEQVAVLDRLSNGRVILGLGRGFQKTMFDAFSVDVKEKRNLFDASLTMMLDAWAGNPVAEGAVLSPLPVQRPHPPLWVAAFGPLALRQAGRLGLPYLASPVEPISMIQENLERWDAALTEFNRPRPKDIPMMRTVFVSRDRKCLAEVRARLEEQVQAQARTSALRGATAADESGVEEWAIIGTPDEVRAGIERYQAIGMNTLVATRLRLSEVPRQWCEESLRLLAEVGSSL